MDDSDRNTPIGERLEARFRGWAEQLSGASCEYLSYGVCYKTGESIYNAWLHDLLTADPPIHKAIQFVVDNPPPAETRKDRYSRGGLSGRGPRSQKEMLNIEVFHAVFNLLRSVGEIEEGRAGGEQLCLRLASIVASSAKSKQPSTTDVIDKPPADDDAGAGEDVPAATETAAIQPKKLKPSEEKAYSQYNQAIECKAELDGGTDRSVYDWINENYLDEGESFPSFSTWKRQLGAARKHYGEPKNTLKANRPIGKSIVRAAEV